MPTIFLKSEAAVPC